MGSDSMLYRTRPDHEDSQAVVGVLIGLLASIPLWIALVVIFLL